MVSEAHPKPAGHDDEESTAELPMLDLEAYEAELEQQRAASPDDSGPTLIQPRLSDTAVSANFANFEAEIAALSADVDRLRTLLLERDAAVADSRQRMSVAEAAAAAAVARLAAAEAEISVAREERESFWQRNESLENDLRAAHALIEELNSTVASQGEQLTEMTQRLLAAERSAAWAGADSDAARAQIAALQEALRSREVRRGLWETIWREADAEIAATSASSGRLSGELEQVLGRSASLEQELSASRAETEAARSALATASSDRDQAKQQLTSTEAALGTRSSELRAQRQRGDSLEAQLQDLTRDVATLRDELATTRTSLQQDLDAARAELAQQSAVAAERQQQLRSQTDEAAAAAAASEARLREALQAAEARAHQLEVEVSLKNARLEAQRTFASTRAPLPVEPALVTQSPLPPASAVPPAAPPPLDIAASLADEAVAASGAFPAVAEARPAELPPVAQLAARRDPELLPDGSPRFLILSEGNAETVFRLGRRTTIGRTDDNDIAIARPSISRHHAVITSGPRQTVIEDLNSTNGVLVNRRRVRETVLRDGDVVHIGKCRFRFTSRLRSPGKA
jgi:hypothetical protein